MNEDIMTQEDFDAEEFLRRKEEKNEHRYRSHIIRTSGGEFYVNKKGRCEDAPCCGCCS